MKDETPAALTVDSSSDSLCSVASVARLHGGDGSTLEDEDMDSAAPTEFLDPITMAVMERPVTLVETGYTYDLASIQEWFARGKNTCPMTNVSLVNKTATSNVELFQAIQSWRQGTPGAPGSWQADAPPCADATQACRRDWLPAGLDACQVFRFHEETYWSLPNSAELSGHQLEITGAVSGCGALLGERVTEQLAPVLMATGAWAFPKAKHDIDCYVAGYSSREFGDQGTQHVAQLLRPRPNPDGSWAYNGVLKSLSLQWNNIGPAGAQALARSLQPHVAADGRRAFNASLKDLNLRRNRIGDAGLEALAAVMALRPDPATGRWLYCSGLTSLDVSCCSIGGPGVSALAEALSPQLDGDGSWAWPPVQSLNLYGNPDIGSEALEALCGALLAPRQDAAGSWVYNPHLASLSVDVSGASDKALAEIAASLAPRWNVSTKKWTFNTALSRLELGNSIPILNIAENFLLKQRLKGALKGAKSDLNNCRKRLHGLFRSGGMLELTL